MDSRKNKDSTATSNTTKMQSNQSGKINSFFPRAQNVTASKSNSRIGTLDKQGSMQGNTTEAQIDSHQVTPTTQLAGAAPEEDKGAGQQGLPRTPGRGGPRERYTEQDSTNDRDKKRGRKEDDGTGDTVMEEAVTKEDTHKANHQDQTSSTQTGTRGQPTAAQKEAKEDSQLRQSCPPDCHKNSDLSSRTPPRLTRFPPWHWRTGIAAQTAWPD